MAEFLRRMKQNDIISAVVMIVLGVGLFLRPGLSAEILCRGLGFVILIYGISQEVTYLRLKKKIVVSPGMSVSAIAMIVLGAWIAWLGEGIMAIFPAAMGIVLLLSGIKNVMQSFVIRNMGDDRWNMAMIMAVITAVLGLILIWNPFTAVDMVIRIIGAFLVYDGITNLWIEMRMK